MTKYSILKGQGHDLHFGIVGDLLTYDFILDSRNFCGINKKMLCGAILKKTCDYYKSDNILEITDSGRFNQAANDILNSEFNKNISLLTKLNSLYDSSKTVQIDIGPGSIHLYLENISKFANPVSMHYYSSDDILCFNKKRVVLTDDDLTDALGTLVLASRLPAYHKEIIDALQK